MRWAFLRFHAKEYVRNWFYTPFKGALSRSFCPHLEYWKTSSHHDQWKLKNRWSLLTADEITALTLFTALFCWRWQEWDGLDFEKFSLNCSQFSDPSLLKAKPKMYQGLLLLQKNDWCLSPKFRGNVFPSGTSEKEGFLYGFDRKTAKVPWQCSIIREGIYGRNNFFSWEKRSSVEEDRRWYFPISNPHTQSLSVSGNTSASGKYSLLGDGEFFLPARNITSFYSSREGL